MSFFIKKINIIALLILFLIDFGALAKDNKIKYTRENISNYFFGTVSLNQDYSKTAFKYLKKIQSIKNHQYLLPNYTIITGVSYFFLPTF